MNRHPLTHLIRKRLSTPSSLTQIAVFMTLTALVSTPLSAQPPPPGQTLPPVVITGVMANTDSVKVSFQPVRGAQDYRIYDISLPKDVKYAGIVHLFPDPWSGAHFVTDPTGLPVIPYRTSTLGRGPTRLDVPAAEIEVNGLIAGQPVTMVVEAVDQLGPAPGGDLANNTNAPLYPKLSSNQSMLGSNAGNTLDGAYSTNGQGVYTANPKVIARSRPFVVKAAGVNTLPSGADASQVFFDHFGTGEACPSCQTTATFTQVGAVDPVNGVMQYTMTTGSGVWDIFYRTVDTKNSFPMIMKKHLMDVLFDGGTPGTNNPLHQGHGLASFSPQQTFDFTGGRILHVTLEVDAHTDSRRWIGVQLAPASDPLNNWYSLNGAINRSDQALFANIGASAPASSPTLDLFTGPNSIVDPTPRDLRILGGAGQAMRWAIRPQQNFQCGHGLDNRSRFDLFFSQTHYAWYEDGLLIDAANLPQPLPFAKAKVYFSHYLYHTDNEVQELKQYAPWEQYWLTTVSYSDERHWNNMGAEVLPANTDWSKLASRVQLPVYIKP